MQAWASRADPPWEDVEVAWYGGQRQPLWVLSHLARWYTPGWPPVAILAARVADPEGTRRMDACFCPDLEATPAQILEGAVMRWSVEVPLQEARAHRGWETQRPWSDRASARITPVLLALFSIVTVLALRWSAAGPIPGPITAWYHKAEPTVVACVAVVRAQLWRARVCVHSAPEPAFVQLPQEAFERLRTGLSFAA